MRISDWSSDVCSSDLLAAALGGGASWNGRVFTAPAFVIQGGSYDNVGGAFSAVDTALTTLDTRVDALEAQPPGTTGPAGPQGPTRSEERRVGKECVSTCRSRGSPSH